MSQNKLIKQINGLFVLAMMTMVVCLTQPASAQTEFDCSAVTEIPASECNALVLLYNSSTNDSAWRGDDWLTNNTPCSWEGITCEYGSVVLLTTPTNWGYATIDIDPFDIPDEIVDLTNLRRLDISRVPIELPPTIGQMDSLTHLTLQRADLTSLPAEIGELSNLGMLDLVNNDFTTFPMVVTTLPSLVELYFNHNDLTAIPPEIGNMTTLRRLHLQGNKLTTIPDEIGNMSDLITLSIDLNRLNAMPATLTNLTNLEVLSLANNNFAEVPDSVYTLLTSPDVAVYLIPNPFELDCELMVLLEYAWTPLDECAEFISEQTEFDCAAVTEIPTLECETLVILYNNVVALLDNPSLYGVQHGDGNWLASHTPCSWVGITCEDGSVVRLEIPRFWASVSLSEEADYFFPAEMANLTQLQRLDVSSFPYTLPPVIGEFSELTHLTIHYPKALPDEIGNLTNLGVLDVRYGSVFTTFPAVITTLPSLRALYMSHHRLTEVPAEIGDMTTLRTLVLNYNELTTLPSELGNLSELVTLETTENRLTSIPDSIGNLTQLETLRLELNQLTSVPATIGNLTHLETLHIAENELTTLPDPVFDLLISKSESLLSNWKGNPWDIDCRVMILVAESIMPLSECEALLAIYDSMGIRWSNGNFNLCKWSRVHCDDEQAHIIALYLDDSMMGDLPAEIGNLTELTILEAKGSKIDSIPPEIGNLTSLTRLDLQGAGVSAFPAEIGNLTELITLDADDNNLTTLPAEIGNLPNLESLTLRGNQLTELPASIGNLSALKQLILGGKNKFPYVCYSYNPDCNDYDRFDDRTEFFGDNNCLFDVSYGCNSPASGNRLTTLPPEIGNLSNLVRLDLDYNQLTALPAEIGNLTQLTALYASYNQLTDIPAEISNITTLKRLILHDNQLTSVPAELGSMTAIAQLDLNDNLLTTVPIDFTNMNQLNYLGLQNNRLTAVPTGIDIWSFDMSDVIFDLSGNQLTADFDCTADDDTPTSECEALVALFNSTDGYGWGFSDSPYYYDYYNDYSSFSGDRWLTTTKPCSWDGVTCTNGRVTALSIVGHEAIGALPGEIGDLTELTDLILFRNHFETLPPEIGNLTKLETLQLEENEITTLPSTIGDLTNLQSLNLSSNQLTNLPDEIGNLINLDNLSLSYNPILRWPTTLTNLQNLRTLLPYGICAPNDPDVYAWVEQNANTSYSGVTPCSDVSVNGQLWIERDGTHGFNTADTPIVGATVRLESRGGYLITTTTDITGQYSFAPLSFSTYTLTVDTTTFTTPATLIDDPDGVLDNATAVLLNAENTSVQHQGFRYWNCAAVTEIPTSECEALVAIYNETGGRDWVDTAQVGWMQSNEPCSWAGIICEGGYVKELQLGSAGMVGDVPSEIGVFSKLTHLNLWDNRLDSVAPELVDLTSMEQLALGRNRWVTFPSHIDQMSNLRGLYLSDAALTTLPFDVGNLTALEDLHLWENQLTELPAGIGNLTNLERLILRENQLTEIPAEVMNLTNLVRLDVKYNNLETLPVELGTSESLAEIDIQGNSIPCSQVEAWTNIQGACGGESDVPLAVDTAEMSAGRETSVVLFLFVLFVMTAVTKQTLFQQSN